MIYLLFNGQESIFVILFIVIVIALTFHEFGHAWMAKYFGDQTAEHAGRLTLNPIAHIDPLGLAMVVFIGFGYAKPVPTNPRNYTSKWASPLVAFAGPGMNLVLAIVTINIYALGMGAGIDFFYGEGQRIFFIYLASINLLLMLFNLIPLGPLDGHYILEHFLPPRLSYKYIQFNQQYGSMLLLSLIVLSFVGVPIFSTLIGFSQRILPMITFV